MKKFLILMSFLFAVVCYAAPPPVPVPQFQTHQLEYMAGDQVSTVQTVQVFQYVAVAHIADFERFEANNLVAEEVTAIKLPAALVVDKSYRAKCSFKKPPSDNRMNATNRTDINKQNSNYGYPFTGNRCYGHKTVLS